MYKLKNALTHASHKVSLVQPCVLRNAVLGPTSERRICVGKVARQRIAHEQGGQQARSERP